MAGGGGLGGGARANTGRRGSAEHARPGASRVSASAQPGLEALGGRVLSGGGAGSGEGGLGVLGGTFPLGNPGAESAVGGAGTGKELSTARRMGQRSRVAVREPKASQKRRGQEPGDRVRQTRASPARTPCQ